MNWKHGAAGLSLLLIIGVLGTSIGSAEEADFDEAIVHLSPDCGCCIEHARYLERSGVDVEVKEHSNAELNQMADQLGIPDSYRSCHLTEVEGYSFKGHIPVDVFNEALDEEPDAEVITLPSMPQGSPGMPGSQSTEWIFFKIDDGELEGEFTSR